MSFLKAEWRKLVLANYKVNPEILKKYIPKGTELDLWNGNCYLSLVGFMFVKTKVLGLSIPFHKHFEEVNLRFYVKRNENEETKRGVVFIKELVPKRAITFIANSIYNEHYETVLMKHQWDTTDNQQKVEYSWMNKEREQLIQVIASKRPNELEPNSETEFITEHYWGYTKINPLKTNEYEVKHPKWSCYDILSSKIDVDFELAYGSEFKFLNNCIPDSVYLAEGSEISVENKRKLMFRD